MKKLFLFLLCSLLCAAPVCAQTVASGQMGDCTWTITGPVGNYTLTVSGIGTMRDDPLWILYRTNIKTLNIQQGVTSIGSYAFENFNALTSATIPNSVTSIDNYAFSKCIGLTSMTIPNSVTNIGYSAFANCSGLTSVTISNSITSIGNYAFSGCSGLTSVTIPNSVMTIGNNVFENCRELTTVNFNATSIESMGLHTFSGCSAFTKLQIGNNVTHIPDYTFFGCRLISVTIPNSVTNIGDGAFYNCSELTSIIIPNSVVSIGNSAFSGCSGLTSVAIPNSVTTINSDVFADCSGLTFVTIPNSVTNIGDYAFSKCIGLTSVTIPNSITTISDCAFYRCSGLTSVTIPNSVTNIGNGAFCDCSGLTSVTIPTSVTTISDWAFSGCRGLTFVTIPTSVTSIGNYAFSKCIELTSVTIPTSVTTISDWAFSGCSGLTSVNIPNSVTSIGSNAFSSCSELTSVTIGNSVTTIGSYAFNSYPSKLTDIYVSNPQPIEIPENIINAITFKNICLHVPEGSESVYATAPVWKNFSCIREGFVLVTGIMVDSSNAALEVGETFQVTYQLVPENATNQNVTYKSNDANVATVDANGVVTAVSPGIAEIVVTTKDGEFTGSLSVLAFKITVITLKEEMIELEVGDTYVMSGLYGHLPAETQLPNNSVKFRFTSSNEKVATVDNESRTVTAVSPGKAEITVTTAFGDIKTTLEVTVNGIPVTGIKLLATSSDHDSEYDMILVKGETGTLSWAIEPENATYKDDIEVVIRYKDIGVAQRIINVDNNSNENSRSVTGMNVGEDIITVIVATKDGTFEAQCKVKVIQPLTEFEVKGTKLDQNKLTCILGKPGYDAGYFMLYYTPRDASTEVIWKKEGENPSAIDVDVRATENEGIYTFDVKGVEPGNAVIIIESVPKYKPEKTIRQEIRVEVIQPITKIELQCLDSKDTFKVGETRTIKATIFPENYTYKNRIEWIFPSLNNVISHPDGIDHLTEFEIKALKRGSAIISVYARDGYSSANNYCLVRVYQPVEGVEIYTSEIEIPAESTVQLYSRIIPENTNNTVRYWFSEDEDIVIVKSGLIYGVKPGVARVGVRTDEGDFKDWCTVTVVEAREEPIPVTGIILEPAELNLTVGRSAVIVPVIAPDSATNKEITWKSSDITIATVNGEGEVTALKDGAVIITATTVDGGFEATRNLTVAPLVMNLSLNKDTLTLAVGESEKLITAVVPENAVREVTWFANNQTVSVNADGAVTGMAPGEALIAVTSEYGEDGLIPATCVVKVIEPILVTDIALNKTSTSLIVGTSETLTATILPSDATNKAVKWTSSNPAIATVDETGRITTIVAGTANITVTTDDSNKTATCAVIVTITSRPGMSSMEGIIAHAPAGTTVHLYRLVSDIKATGLEDYMLVASTVTDANGWYRFENLPEGNYKVVVQIAGYNSQPSADIALTGTSTVDDINFKVNSTDHTIKPDDSVTSIKIAEKPLAAVYPNPTSGLFTLNFEMPGTYRITITDATGKVISRQTISDQIKQLNIENYPTGVYLLLIDNGKHRSVVRIVKEKR